MRTRRPRGFLPTIKVALVLFGAIGVAVGYAVWLEYGWVGVAGFGVFVVGLATVPWIVGAQSGNRSDQAWGLLTQAADAVAAGADVPSPEQWEPWLVEMAGSRALYEGEIYERAAQIDHPFREPFQRLLCGFPTDRAKTLAELHLRTHPDDLVAPQLTAYLIALGSAQKHGGIVDAALRACPPDELADPAASLLSRAERGGTDGWTGVIRAHRDRLRDALDPELQPRWDAALQGVVDDADAADATDATVAAD